MFYISFCARTLGGTIGVSIGQAIYSSTLKHKITKLNIDFDTSPAALSESVRQLKNIAVSAPRFLARQDTVLMSWTVERDGTDGDHPCLYAISQHDLDRECADRGCRPFDGFVAHHPTGPIADDDFLTVLFIREYSLKRTTIQGGPPKEDVEAGTANPSDDAGNEKEDLHADVAEQDRDGTLRGISVDEKKDLDTETPSRPRTAVEST